MKISETVSDRTRLDTANVDVEIEVDHLGGSSSQALEIAERIADSVRVEIREIADEGKVCESDE